MPRWFKSPSSRFTLILPLLAVFGAGVFTQQRFQVLPPLTSAEASTSSRTNKTTGGSERTEHWHTDLRIFATELPRWHANAFHSLPSAEFRQMVSDLDQRLPQLTDAEITVELMRIVSRIGDSHTSIDTWLDRFHRYPIRLSWVGKDLRVMEVTSGAERAKGARLIRIGRTGIDEAYVRLISLATRETELGARNDSEYLFPRAEVLAALKLLPGTGGRELHFRGRCGQDLCVFQPMRHSIPV